jgi:MFS family permease
MGFSQLTAGNKQGRRTGVKTQDILPVVISVIVIILIAVIEKQNKTIAAITAVMPLTAPLALWIVYSSSGGEQAAMSEFTLGLVLGLLPTLGFAIAAWLAVRIGWKLVPVLLVGYGTWGIGTLLIALLRNLLVWK